MRLGSAQQSAGGGHSGAGSAVWLDTLLMLLGRAFFRYKRRAAD